MKDLSLLISILLIQFAVSAQCEISVVSPGTNVTVCGDFVIEIDNPCDLEIVWDIPSFMIDGYWFSNNYHMVYTFGINGGPYTINASALDDGVVISSVDILFTVDENDTLEFAVNESYGCTNTDLNFELPVGALSYEWFLYAPTGFIQTSTTNSYILNNPDIMESVLMVHVQSADGCWQTLTQNVIVYDNSFASFTIDTPCLGSDINLALWSDIWDDGNWYIDGTLIASEGLGYVVSTDDLFTSFGNDFSLTYEYDLPTCILSTSDDVFLPSNDLVVSLPTSLDLCSGECLSFSPTITGGSGNFTYEWSPADMFDDPTSPTPIFCAGDFQTISLTVYDDNQDCGITVETDISILDYSSLIAYSFMNTTCNGNDIDVNQLVYSGNDNIISLFVYCNNCDGTETVNNGVFSSDEVIHYDLQVCATFDTNCETCLSLQIWNMDTYTSVQSWFTATVCNNECITLEPPNEFITNPTNSPLDYTWISPNMTFNNPFEQSQEICNAGNISLMIDDPNSNCSVILDYIISEGSSTIDQENFCNEGISSMVVCSSPQEDIVIDIAGSSADYASIIWQSMDLSMLANDVITLNVTDHFYNSGTTGQQYIVTATTIGGCEFNGEVLIVATDDCVWPGDANDDGEVTMIDMLNVGIAFGNSDWARNSVSHDWTGFGCFDWDETFPDTGVDQKFGDCNGDGVVDYNDTAAIEQNFSLTHSKGEATEEINAEDPPIFIDLPESGTALPEDLSFSVPVILGSEEAPVEDLYGIVFTIEYDETLILDENISIDFNPCWIAENDNRITLSILQESGSLEIGISRIDQENITGFGDIATLSFVIIEDVEGKVNSFTANFSVDNVYAISNTMEEISIAPLTTSMEIISSSNNVLSYENISVYPNPASVFFRISSPVTTPQDVIIYNIEGKKIHSFILNNSETINVSHWVAGTYFLKSGSFHHKILIQ